MKPIPDAKITIFAPAGNILAADGACAELPAALVELVGWHGKVSPPYSAPPEAAADCIVCALRTPAGLFHFSPWTVTFPHCAIQINAALTLGSCLTHEITLELTNETSTAVGRFFNIIHLYSAALDAQAEFDASCSGSGSGSGIV